MFKPKPEHVRYRQLLFDGKTDSEIVKELRISPDTVFDYFKIEGFGEWLWDELKKIRHRFMVRIALNLYQIAQDKEAPESLIELALRVGEVYMPTNKSISESIGKIKREEAEELKKKSEAMKTKRDNLKLVKGSNAANA